MSKYIMQINNLTGNDSDTFHLNNFDFNLKYGEIHVLVGENNSGQKSFINILSGMEGNFHGEIIFKEKIFKNFIDRIKNIGFLFEKSSLIEEASIAENLFFLNFPRMNKLPLIDWNKIKNRAENILDLLNIELDPKTKVRDLSMEERKFVDFAKIILRKPEVIIMNNPSENISSEKFSKFYDIIKLYKTNGGSIVYVTKNWEEALKIADRISVLVKGRIENTFTAVEAKKNPKKLLNMLGNYSISEIKSENESADVLDAVFEAAKYLTSEYELKDVLLLLAKHITKVMNADSCSIDLIDEETEAIIDTFEFNTLDILQPRLKKKVILEIIEQDDIYYSNQHVKEFATLFESQNNIRTVICIPVLIRSRVTGVIQIFYKNFYVHSKDETKYLSTFARQAAIAIEDTRLMGRSNLLQESHHRIKNNLQAISSFIFLQKQFITPEQEEILDDILENIVSRIKSIAAVHDILSKNQIGRSIINIKTLVDVIIEFINTDPNIKIKLELDDIFVPYDKATSIALIVNEVVSNSLKHAFIKKDRGLIEIKCELLKSELLIVIRDNGIGIDKDFRLMEEDSLGLYILTSIIKDEFDGEITFTNDNGTIVEIKIPKKNVFSGEQKSLN